jgi:hypothetical protein
MNYRPLLRVVIIVAFTGCGSSSTPAGPTADSGPTAAASIAISGGATLTEIGQTSQLTATATLSNGTTQTVTSTATWQSSTPGAITVSSTGLATAVAAGQSTISAATLGRTGNLAMTVAIAAVPTTYEGSLAGTGQSGTFKITIQPDGSASPPASGTLTLSNGGSTTTLSGVLNSSTNALNLTGGGFAFTGTINQGAASGTYLGPSTISGRFAGLDSTRSPVTVLCGRYDGSEGSGTWNVQFIASGAASGVTRPDLSARDPQPRTTLLTGQLTGTTLSLRSVEDGATATGIVQGTTVIGTHDKGTFSGSTAQCR